MIPGMSIMAATPPRAEEFPAWGLGWYVLGKSDEITRRPAHFELFGREVVSFRLSSGRPVVMDARCWHMGADLSTGQMTGDQIVCPFHGWRYGASGNCEFIPNQDEIPAGARQRTYDTAEKAGYIFVFPRSRCAYPPPFFDAIDPADLVAAPPFDLFVDCPWWLVGTNGFDLQHFIGLHDRRLVAAPAIDIPHTMARRIVATFEVCGNKWRDRLTRKFAGRWVTMDVTVWSGTLAFVVARFRDSLDFDGRSACTTTYGMTEIRALPSSLNPKCLVRVTVFRHRRRRLSALDKLEARVKRHFIQAFLQPDALLLSRTQYDPSHLTDADGEMTHYLSWLASISHDQESAWKEPA
jgi:nitrite reductase/ring-hydroxylating ferredoxin subunit